MLAAIFGGIFNGLGYGLLFRLDGSSGGLDIVAAIIRKYYSFNMGGVIFAFNCIIMTISAFMFGVMPAMYTLISMFLSATVTDKVVAGFVHRWRRCLYPSREAGAVRGRQPDPNRSDQADRR